MTFCTQVRRVAAIKLQQPGVELDKKQTERMKLAFVFPFTLT